MSGFELVPPGWEPISPQLKMGNNDLCWCKSGKKWKKCHKGRELLQQVNYFDLMEVHSEEFGRGYCSHPQASSATCHSKIVKSHSIQRKKVLDSIAEDGHVFSTSVPSHKLFNSKKEFGLNLELKKIGIGKASTFPGFCSKHDTDLFQKIENANLNFDRQTAYIFSLRALALEVFKKKAAIRALDEQRQLADRGLPFMRQAEIQSLYWASQSGQKVAIRDLNYWQDIFYEGFPNKIPERFNYAFIVFDRKLPIVACTSFAAECSFDGKRLADLSSLNTQLSPVYMNIINTTNSGVAIFGWHSDATASRIFIESLLNVQRPSMATALIRLCFEFTENSYLQPSWWSKLESVKKAGLAKRILSGTIHQEHKQTCLMDDGVELLESEVTDVILHAT